MNKTNINTSESSGLEILITRFVDAPRALVYKAWTELEQIEQWWGPKGFQTKVTELDFRPGGKWRYVMVGPDGTEYPSVGIFTEIIGLQKIVTTDEFGDASQSQGLSGIICAVKFEDLPDNKTKLSLLITHRSPEDRETHEKMGAIEGWGSTLDCLDEYLKSK